MIIIITYQGIFDDAPIVYEYQRFKRAGFHDTRHKDLTVYEGSPNRKNNVAWERLIEGNVQKHLLISASKLAYVFHQWVS